MFLAVEHVMENIQDQQIRRRMTWLFPSVTYSLSLSMFHVLQMFYNLGIIFVPRGDEKFPMNLKILTMHSIIVYCYLV